MAERHRDLDRLLTFVDAVVAIAITLLVLPLAEVGQELGSGGAEELLGEHGDDLLGFVLSFLVIARLWLAQHHTVSTLERQSPPVIWLLMAWTFTIVFLPFPTSLVAASDHDATAKLLYVGTMAVSSLLLACIAYAIRADPTLRDTDEKPALAPAIGVTIGFLLALAVMLAFPETGYWPLLLLLLVDPVVRVVRRLTARRAPSV